MKIALIVSLALCALAAGSMADKPKVTRPMLEAMEKSVDGKLQNLYGLDPAEIVGVTQGAYINGYGAVFMSEVNLAPATESRRSILPSSPKKSSALTTKRSSAWRRSGMRCGRFLIDSAASLDTVPADEQVAMGVSLFYWTWENREGLPAQIVMHAPKKAVAPGQGGNSRQRPPSHPTSSESCGSARF